MSMAIGGNSSPQPDERRFAQPPLVGKLALWGAVVTVLAAVTVIAMRVEGLWDNEPLLVLSLAFCAVSLYFSVLGLKGSRDTFVAAEDGLWQHSPGKPSVFLRWEEIGDVYPENVMQRLAVTDRSGRKRLAIEFHVQDYGELRRIILERART